MIAEENDDELSQNFEVKIRQGENQMAEELRLWWTAKAWAKNTTKSEETLKGTFEVVVLSLRFTVMQQPKWCAGTMADIV